MIWSVRRFPAMLWAASWVFLGCGAPLKSADSVQKVFQDSESLQAKVAKLCSVLETRNEQPNLIGIGLKSEVCNNPGGSPLDYSGDMKSLGFTNIDSQKDQGNKETTFYIRTRSEVWLNSGLLQLAQILFNQLDKEANGLLDKNNGSGAAGNNSFDFKINGKPEFDKDNFSLKLSFTLKSTREQNGNIDLNNDFKVEGALFDKKAFAATAVTTEDQPVEKSLMKSGKILIVVVPYAGDVFIDVTTDLLFHSFGINSSMEKQIVDALGKGLKSVPDLLTGLKNRNQTTQ